MCCIVLYLCIVVFLLGLLSQRSLANSLMEPNPGCTDFCIKSIKTVLDQQLTMELKMKNIENNLRKQQIWAENLMNHQDKLENRQKLKEIESRLKKNEDTSSTQLQRLDSVEHKLLELQRMDNSGENGLLEIIERVKQHLSDQQERNDSDIGRLSERLEGLEKKITEQQESAGVSFAERLEKLEGKQRQLVLNAQQMLERLRQVEKQIAVEHAKRQLFFLSVGKNDSYLYKYRDRLTLIEKPFVGKEEKISSNETTVAAAIGLRINKLEKDFTSIQQYIELEVNKSSKLLDKVKNQLTDHQTRLENEAKKLSDSQTKLSKLQDQLTNQLKTTEINSKAIKESESKLKTLWKNRFFTVQKNGSEGNKLTEVVKVLQNQFAGHQTKLENEAKKLSKLQDELKNQQNKIFSQEASIKESQSKLRTLWTNRFVMFQKLGPKYYYFERNEKLNWTDAGDRCKELDSHLASVQDQQEFDLVTKDLYDAFYYWVDINDIETEGVYMSSTTGKEASFLKWRQTPDNWNGDEDCVELAYESEANAMGMNDIHCSEKHMYICEK